MVKKKKKKKKLLRKAEKARFSKGLQVQKALACPLWSRPHVVKERDSLRKETLEDVCVVGEE